MALVTTISGVIGVLAAMALFLWFSAYMESRHLGPVGAADASQTPVDAGGVDLAEPMVVDAAPVMPAVDPLTSAA